MALVLPLGHNSDKKIEVLGSCTYVKSIGRKHVFVTCNHLFANLKSNPFIILPEHGGNISKIQSYPFVGNQLSLRDCVILFSDSFNDLVFLITKDDDAPEVVSNLIPPNIIENYNEVNLGDMLSVFTYPLSISESFLMTSDVCFVSALTKRLLNESFGVNEYVINYHSVKGASGGGVFRHKDNKLIGILRGNLAKTVFGSAEINSLTSFVIPANIITENLKEI